MDRSFSIKQLKTETFEILIIGGGATGLGAAVDAASRGYNVGLVDASDFASGTSSKSTKLAHGGVRYLQKGNISLVIEALRERGIMMKNAPHLVRKLGFVIPSYNWWSNPFYILGLKIYDTLSGKLGFGTSKIISKEETIKRIPNVNTKGLRGGVLYYDGQFDDARYAISLAQTACREGAILANYCKVTGLLKEKGKVVGILAIDVIHDDMFEVRAKSIINCTGVYSDEIIQMDNPNYKESIRPSQGVHIVIDKSFLDGEQAIMVPKTTDGRVLFAVPWGNVAIIGTTDATVDRKCLDPIPTTEEIDFILENVREYLVKTPNRSDILSVFAGLRPLALNRSVSKTRDMSRKHRVVVTSSGLISVQGGKWTTYRKMGEDAIDNAIIVGDLPLTKSISQSLQIYGFDNNVDWSDPLHIYGTNKEKIYNRIIRFEEKSLSQKFELYPSMIRWAVLNEMAMTLEDMLSRRHRAVLLNAKETQRIAPLVASIMAGYLNKDRDWIEDQLEKFERFNQSYLLANA